MENMENVAGVFSSHKIERHPPPAPHHASEETENLKAEIAHLTAQLAAMQQTVEVQQSQLLAKEEQLSQLRLRENKLAQSEQKFRLLVENTPDILTRFDRQMRHLYVNPAVTRATGLSVEAFIGKTNQDLGMPEERVLLWESAFQKIFETGQEQSIEFDFPSPEGIRYYQSRLSPELAEDGAGIDFVISVARDVTEIKRSEQRYRELADAMPSLVWTTLPDGYTDFFNQRWFDYTGLSLEQTYGNGWQEAIHPEDLPRCLALSKEVSQTGKTYEIEYRIRRGSDGTYRWHLARATPMRDSITGEITHWVGSATDIEAQKRSEAAAEEAHRKAQETAQHLAESLSLLDSMLTNSSIGLGFLDRELRYLKVNPALAKMNGLSVEEHLGRSIDEVIPAPVRTIIKPLFQRILETGVPVLDLEVSGKTRGNPNQTIIVKVSYCPLWNEEGEVIGIGTAIVDITKSKQAEEALRQSEERYRTLVKNFPNGTVILFDYDLRHIIADGKGLEDIGLRPDMLEGKTLWEILLPSDGTNLEPYYREALAGKESSFEIQYNNHIYQSYALPVKNEQGEIIAGMIMSQDITEARTLSKQLTESLSLLDALLANTPLGLGLVDRELRYIRVNPALAKINGLTIEQHTGRHLNEVLPPVLASSVEPLIRQVLETGETLLDQELSSETPSKPGQIHFWTTTYYPIRDHAGQLLGVGFIVRDVTKSKMTEETLRQSQERFRIAQELSPDGFIIMRSLRDEQGEIIDFVWEYINPAAERFLQNKSEDLLGQRLLQVYPDHRPRGVFDHFVEIVKSGKTYDEEIEFTVGRVSNWFRRLSVKLNDGLVLSISDITKRKQAEKTLNFLLEASILLSTTLDYEVTLQNLVHLTVPYLADWCFADILDEASGKFQRMAIAHQDPLKEKRAYEDLYPITLGSVVGSTDSWKSLLIPELTEELLKMTAKNEEQLNDLRELNLKSCMLIPLVARERVLGVVTYLTTESNRTYTEQDLTLAELLVRRAALALDNARLHQEVQKALATQKELDYYKDLFMSVASHELRTPLTVMSGYAQLLENSLRKQEQTIQSIAEAKELKALQRDLHSAKTIRSQIDRMNNLVGQLLDFSRIQNRGLKLDYSTSVDLKALVEMVIEQHSLTIKDHPIAIQAEVDETESIVATCDEGYLGQVLNNLIVNAAKYSAPDQPITIGFNKQRSLATSDNNPTEQKPLFQKVSETETKTEWAVIWVKDEGRGIGSEEQAHIFDSFYRTKAVESSGVEGLGLGLYISYEIVKQHGGHMWLESQIGQGSTFYFAIPLEPPK
ncbi:MAG: PAS domain-containing protein [Chloroflexi bacterium]|nr:PAS domain-containing protein [Chloroflexota bacterium]